MSSQDILVAKASFFYELDGASVMVPKGTTVRVGHPLLDGRGDMFEPITVNYDNAVVRGVEQATAAPGEVRELPKRRGPGRPPKNVGVDS